MARRRAVQKGTRTVDTPSTGQTAMPDLNHYQNGPHAAASALRFPALEAAFCALYAGNGGAVLRRFQRSVPARWRRRIARPPGRKRPERSATRSAGRSIPPGCRSSVAPRFCSCCWEIWAGRAAASWHCAAMLRFKAPPIFRLCIDILPGYLNMPKFGEESKTLARTTSRNTSRERAGGTISTSTL